MTAIILTPAAADLLVLICQKPVPSSYCDLKPKNELTRAGFVQRVAEMQNSRRNPGGTTFQRVMLYPTAAAREWIERNK